MSSDPSSGVMKPKPLSSRHCLTVPVRLPAVAKRGPEAAGSASSARGPSAPDLGGAPPPVAVDDAQARDGDQGSVTRFSAQRPERLYETLPVDVHGVLFAVEKMKSSPDSTRTCQSCLRLRLRGGNLVLILVLVLLPF